MIEKEGFNFDEFARRWQSPCVARTDEALEKFSGGSLPSARTMANLDCQGIGPKGRFRVGRCVAYPVESLIEWMQTRNVSGPGVDRVEADAAGGKKR